ncbi:Na+/H+ antiporter subunit E [Celeribacter persicus]|uniref:Multicomponent Na+:H+ antiporter subunit E n=1 Tax=Celeribacter persicus TaxID=1651082 RepID=A0A2T5HCI4_9RHOB|nr:Na+/H+ antiporter subunit E [Celeribacter persicus]PTQ69274.1 multicomponent Na+:H+ antiporter subunit E [Celeribacter persicus]
MSDTGTSTQTGLKTGPIAPPLRRLATRLFATLLLFWLMLNGSISPATLFTGVIVAGAIAVFFARDLSFLSGFNLTPEGIGAAFLFIGYFLKELVKANLALATLVLTPSLPISPAIVKVRTRLTDPVGRLLLANAITLTPGTLTCEIRGDHLYVHWVTARDTELDAATAEIVAEFERYLEKMYG